MPITLPVLSTICSAHFFAEDLAEAHRDGKATDADLANGLIYRFRILRAAAAVCTALLIEYDVTNQMYLLCPLREGYIDKLFGMEKGTFLIAEDRVFLLAWQTRPLGQIIMIGSMPALGADPDLPITLPAPARPPGVGFSRPQRIFARRDALESVYNALKNALIFEQFRGEVARIERF
ncbi:hypothetical protein BD779DRAFT_1478530 [Infundibulicybe gibba]|nr:hypothetical protein BD779DRAFT_1478530 [Infundibulicybe gibba]